MDVVNEAGAPEQLLLRLQDGYYFWNLGGIAWRSDLINQEVLLAALFLGQESQALFFGQQLFRLDQVSRVLVLALP